MRFNGRIRGVARCNRRLGQQDWKGVGLEERVRRQLQPFIESNLRRLEIMGSAITLLPEAVQSIGLALHELATNASKHGALSNLRGKVSVTWDVTDGPNGRRFQLIWLERDGPAVSAPARKGFGSIVLGQMTRSALACDTDAEFAAEGLRWTLNCPATGVLAITY